MQEKKVWKVNGYLGLIILLLITLYGIYSIIMGAADDYQPEVTKIIIGIVLLLIAYLFLTSMTVVSPNQAKVLTFFGKYLGTIRSNGLFMTVPLTNKRVISLKVRNFSTNTLKVNDIDGNPIDIAAVVVFKVVNTAKALFDVDYYDSFVEIQSETAVRHVATKYPYDSNDDAEITLRSNVEDISKELSQELQERLEVAGVEVIDVRISHLAYATEIAGAMLQKQQAKAVLSARQLIVEGAVSMTQSAIEQMENSGKLELSPDAKVQLVNNLLVSIISDKGAQPIISTDSVEN
ncbi:MULTISPECIES: SPFH domain-containing protein [unclassified Enterococcus]|uniref:SPFH domain-containing protein n=1 Tax=unclassified Enterococcus TaxID=2608891 RepID=UPI0015577820|nr:MULTISPECIES: SPFH domain-containing protein [unclassified Enterococcus]MBS7576036.1 SPFH domain-containing protein [Enterococcus sp. MMGLQ5-2]MBS7583269.1 SPFH domain-containing protein [Enterococcus sp. MMGLQ5-1]NPD11129.1 SPFH domain-containing protein [Enterococcus sp. MMGLQ5-1]NPD35872.1 SPFH domain-containing protein [Enterococcus sp. MMGLQ5-2]